MATMEQWQQEHLGTMAGAWVLDLSRSDTMQRYLEVSGMPATHAYTHVLAERKHGGALNLIHLDDTTLTIHKRTYRNNYTETFELGEEKVTSVAPSRVSISTTVSNLGSSSRGYVCLIRNTSTPERQQNTEVLERRYVTNGGLCHIQEIKARSLTTGEECGIVRTWRRVMMTHEHRATLGLLMVGGGVADQEEEEKQQQL
ncbi:unnamed protein product [Ectocarpus sp. 13 AM-2016]